MGPHYIVHQSTHLRLIRAAILLFVSTCTCTCMWSEKGCTKSNVTFNKLPRMSVQVKTLRLSYPPDWIPGRLAVCAACWALPWLVRYQCEHSLPQGWVWLSTWDRAYSLSPHWSEGEGAYSGIGEYRETAVHYNFMAADPRVETTFDCSLSHMYELS